MLNYNKMINSTKSGSLFVIQPLRMEDLDLATNLISNCFRNRDVITVHLDIPLQEHLTYIRAYCQRSIEDGLAFICRDITQNKIAAVDISIDMCRQLKTPIDLKALLPKDSKIFDLEELFRVFKTPEKIKADQAYEVIFNIFDAIDDEYINCGLLTEMMKFLEEDHPLTSSGSIILSEVTNELSQKNRMKTGYKTLGQVQLQYYNNKKGTNPFAGFKQTVDKMGTVPFDRVCLMMWKKIQGCVV